MRKALFICLPSTLRSSDIRITPSSQAYSTSRLLAMVMKFWFTVLRMMPIRMANVIVDVAIMMHGRFSMNCSVRNFFGIRKRIASKFSRMAMMP